MRTLLALLIALLPLAATAQEPSWAHLGGPAPTDVEDLVLSSAGTLFTYNMGVLYRRPAAASMWQRVPTSLHVNHVQRGPDGDLWAGTQTGLYRSLDDGLSWSLVGLDGIDLPTIAVSSEGNLLARQGPSHGPGTLHRSTDGGASWQTIPPPDILFPDVTVEPLVELPTGITLAACRRGTQGHEGGIYTYVEASDTWEKRATTGCVSDIVETDGTIYAASYSGYSEADGMLLRSTDGGATFSPVEFGGSEPLALTVDAAGELWVGTDQGIYHDGALVGLEDRPVRSLVVTDEGDLWAGTAAYCEWRTLYSMDSCMRGNGLLRRAAEATPWTHAEQELDAGRLKYVTRLNDDKLFVVTRNFSQSHDHVWTYDVNDDTWTRFPTREASSPQGYVMQAEEGDATIRVVLDFWMDTFVQDWLLGEARSDFNLPVDFDSQVRRVLVAGDGTLTFIATDGAFRSTDRGHTWTQTITSDMGALLLGAPPQVWIQRTQNRGYGEDSLALSTDGGATWTPRPQPEHYHRFAATAAGDLFVGGRVSSVYPGDPAPLYYLPHHADAWIPIALPLRDTEHVRTVRLASDGTMIVLTEERLLASSDGGRSFRSLHAAPLPDGVPNMIEVDTEGHLYAAFPGYGLYRTHIASRVADEELEELAHTTMLTAAPNPFASATSFSVTLPAAGLVDLCIYDAMGREVARVAEQEQMAAGRHTLDWSPPAALPSGTYVVRLTAGGQISTQAVVLVR